MGLNKKYISKDYLKKISQGTYIEFYKHFNIHGVVFITLDNFSSEILNEMMNCTLQDESKIIEIMKKCK